MSTAFNGIVAAFVAALQAAPAVSDDIEHARTRTVPEDSDTAVNVFFDGAAPSPGAIRQAPVDWTTRIVVELYARSSSVPGDLAIDELIGATYARLAADSTLGGLVSDTGVPTIDAVYDSHGQKTGVYQLAYSVLHRTDNLTIA